jgi:hypothetical protein
MFTDQACVKLEATSQLRPLCSLLRGKPINKTRKKEKRKERNNTEHFKKHVPHYNVAN